MSGEQWAAGILGWLLAVENAILKQVYLAIMNAQTRWNGQIFHWSAIQNDLNAYFSDRIK